MILGQEVFDQSQCDSAKVAIMAPVCGTGQLASRPCTTASLAVFVENRVGLCGSLRSRSPVGDDGDSRQFYRVQAGRLRALHTDHHSAQTDSR